MTKQETTDLQEGDKWVFHTTARFGVMEYAPKSSIVLDESDADDSVMKSQLPLVARLVWRAGSPWPSTTKSKK